VSVATVGALILAVVTAAFPTVAAIGDRDPSPPPGLQISTRFPGSGTPGAPPYVEMPKDWRVPPGVTFRIVGTPRVERGRITLRGQLANTTKTKQRLYLWEAGHGLFQLMLVGDGVAQRPVDARQQPPEVYPATAMYTIPAGARWRFESSIDLRSYAFPSGETATLYWEFNSADHMLRSEIAVKLP